MRILFPTKKIQITPGSLERSLDKCKRIVFSTSLVVNDVSYFTFRISLSCRGSKVGTHQTAHQYLESFQIQFSCCSFACKLAIRFYRAACQQPLPSPAATKLVGSPGHKDRKLEDGKSLENKTINLLLDQIPDSIGTVLVIENMTERKLVAPHAYTFRGIVQNNPVDVGPWRRETMTMHKYPTSIVGKIIILSSITLTLTIN